MISPDCKAFCVLSDRQIRAHYKYFQIKTHVQTAHKSYDLNMDFRSFDNGFKQQSNKFDARISNQNLLGTVNKILAHQIRISEILPWDRKSYLTQSVLPRLSREG